MNVEIFYRLSGRPGGWESSHDIATASRTQLLWYCFAGSVGMRTESRYWETDFDWVPVPHFALSLLEICEQLKTADRVDARYGFTEADASIQFHRRSDMVTVSCSFKCDEIACTLTKLRCAVKDFVIRVLDELTSAYPVFADTSVAIEMRAKASAM